MTKMNRALLQYRVGGLLYCPAVKEGLAEKICENRLPCLTSAAFCLEDSVRDEALAAAEANLCETLRQIKARALSDDALPLIFIRVRTPEHLLRMHARLSSFYDIVSGYILPKFDLTNCDAYIDAITRVNADRNDPIYIMPILESGMIADPENRVHVLRALKVKMDGIRDYVLNVRVGGNDFSNLYGLRRHVDQNIYQIGVIRAILEDIISVFAADYVVSGPVWEYFGTDDSAPWAAGLKAELALDRLNGFIGKTAIHPCQLPLIYESMKVSRSDYEDARGILDWQSAELGVGKSFDGSRMNEVKCHGKWAARVLALAELYGIREN